VAIALVSPDFRESIRTPGKTVTVGMVKIVPYRGSFGCKRYF
jgi:hypothetical protein